MIDLPPVKALIVQVDQEVARCVCSTCALEGAFSFGKPMSGSPENALAIAILSARARIILSSAGNIVQLRVGQFVPFGQCSALAVCGRPTGLVALLSTRGPIACIREVDHGFAPQWFERGCIGMLAADEMTGMKPVFNFFEDFFEIFSDWYNATVAIGRDYT